MMKPTVHDPRPEGRLARARFSAAFMSDTKWRKLFVAVGEALPDLERMTVKFVDVDEPRRMRFPPSLVCPLAYMDTIEFGPTELRSIEWLEVQADLSGPLTGHGRFPLLISDGRTRVVGYADLIPTNVRNPRGADSRRKTASKPSRTSHRTSDLP